MNHFMEVQPLTRYLHIYLFIHRKFILFIYLFINLLSIYPFSNSFSKHVLLV